MQQPGPPQRLGGGGVSVAWAVRWGPEDRDGHLRSLDTATRVRVRGRVGAASGPCPPAWPGLRSPGCFCILGIRFRPKREIKTEMKRKERGLRARSSPPKEAAHPHLQDVYLCFPVAGLNSAFWPYLLEGGTGGFVHVPRPPPPPSSGVRRAKGRLREFQGRASGPCVTPSTLPFAEESISLRLVVSGPRGFSRGAPTGHSCSHVQALPAGTALGQAGEAPRAAQAPSGLRTLRLTGVVPSPPLLLKGTRQEAASAHGPSPFTPLRSLLREASSLLGQKPRFCSFCGLPRFQPRPGLKEKTRPHPTPPPPKCWFVFQ